MDIKEAFLEEEQLRWATKGKSSIGRAGSRHSREGLSGNQDLEGIRHKFGEQHHLATTALAVFSQSGNSE